MATRRLEVVIVGNASQLQATFGKAATGVEAFGKKMAAVGAGLSRHVTLPIVAIGAASVDLGMKFQTAMEQVHTQAGASQKEVNSMSKAVLGLAHSTEQGPVALAKALYELESVGMRGARALKTLHASSELAAVGGADLQTATSAVASAMVAWQIPTNKATQTAATLNAIVGAGKMHMQDLVGAMGTKLPGVAAQLGISLKSVGAALAAFTDQGVGAETAATNLVTPLFKMAVVTAPKAQKAFKEMGLGVHQLADDFRTGGIAKAIQDLHDHLQKFSKNNRTDLVAEAFGGSRGSAPILQMLKVFDSATNSVQARQDLIGRNTKKFGSDVAAEHATLSHKMKVAWSSMQSSLISFSAILAPVVTKLAGMIQGAAVAFQSLSPHMKRVVVDVLAVGAALGPMLVVGGKVIQMVKLLGSGAVGAANLSVGAFSRMRAAWIGLRFASADAMTSMGSKAGLVGGALLMGAFIGTMLNKIPAVRQAASKIAGVIGDAFGSSTSAAEKFDSQMQRITGSVQGLARAFKAATNPVDRNTAAIRLHIAADNAAEASFLRTIVTLKDQGATMDGTSAKSKALRAAVEGLKQAEADAAGQAAALKNQLNALPASKTIDIQINTHQSGGGGAFGQNLPAGARRPKGKGSRFMGHASSLTPVFGLESELSGAQSLRDSTQAGFDAADQAARRSKDLHDSHLGGKKNAATVRSAIQDLRALAVEEGRAKKLAAIDLKITGIQKAIDFKNVIAGIRTQLQDVASQAADAFRTQRTADITDNSPEAQQLKQLQDADKLAAATQEQAALEHNLAVAQAGYTREQAAADQAAVDKQRADAATLLANSQAADDLKGIEKAKALQKDADAQEAAIQQGGQAVIDAQNAIDAFKNQSREQELQDTIDANVKALDGPQGEVTLYKQGLADKLSALVDNLNGKGGQKDAYAQFVSDVNTILDGLNLPTGTLTFTASSTDEAAVTGDTSTGTPKRTKAVTNNKKKAKGKTKKRAGGGPVRRGEPYIVGEEGEELFVPDQSGKIVPHGKRHRMGRGGNYIHYGDIKLGGGTDVDRFLNRVALKLA